jgi:hypothetical protein
MYPPSRRRSAESDAPHRAPNCGLINCIVLDIVIRLKGMTLYFQALAVPAGGGMLMASNLVSDVME